MENQEKYYFGWFILNRGSFKAVFAMSQKLQLRSFSELERTCRIHAEGKDHAPMLNVVGDSKMFISITPDIQYDDERNLPSGHPAHNEDDSK